jgi:hypothetical protein
MTTRPPTTSGCAYTSPSSIGDTHRSRTPLAGDGPSNASPLRATSPSYVVQCATDAVDPVGFRVVDVTSLEALERDVVDEPPDRRAPDEHAPNTHIASANPANHLASRTHHVYPEANLRMNPAQVAAASDRGLIMGCS